MQVCRILSMATDVIGLVILLMSSACGPLPEAFECHDQAACVIGSQHGYCESTHLCSFVDASCASGRRYGTYAGESSGACVNTCQDGSDGGMCACPSGWAGASCDTCASGYYGASCTACPSCGNHGNCDDGLAGNGTCTCDTGWTGAACDACAQGYSGPTCSPTSCPDCGAHGSCNTSSNTCTCDAGWTGATCDSCASGYYGASCAACSFCGNGSCDDGLTGSGACTCDTAWAGASCNVCASAYYGPSCTACPYCDNGSCSDGFAGSGTCVCSAGWSDATCSSCALGYYGPSCTACPSCGSHSSCDDGLAGSGACVCDTGWAGINCDTCAVGYSGPTCSPTSCPDCGAHGTCNTGNNTCSCDTGWTGTTCSTCAPGYYGASCSACPSCGAHGSCNDGLTGGGTCSCNTGWTGSTCGSCASGYYGASCTACPYCGNGSCSDGLAGSGTCACDTGWTGASCSSCASGYYGASCSACPNCGAHGSCNDGLAGSGTCACDTGWAGALCNTCAPGYSGPTCSPTSTWDNGGAPIATADSLANDTSPTVVSSVTTSGARTMFATVVGVSQFSNGSHGVSSVTGCGLTWAPVRKRYDGNAIFAEIWRAHATSALSSCSVTVSYAGSSDNKHVAIYAAPAGVGIGASADVAPQSGTEIAIQMPALRAADSSVLAVFGVEDNSNGLTPIAGQNQTLFSSGWPSAYHVAATSGGVGTTPLVGYTNTIANRWGGLAVEITPQAGTPGSIVFDGGPLLAQAHRNTASSAALDTGTFSTSGANRLILVIAMTNRDTSSSIGFSSVVVDPGGSAIALSKHSTAYNDSWEAVELWYGVAASKLTNVIVRGSTASSQSDQSLLVVAVSGYKSSYLGVAGSSFTNSPYLSQTLASTTPGSLCLFAGYAESPNSAAVSPFPGNAELYDKGAFYERYADYTLGTAGGRVTVGGADGAGHNVKGVAWEILSQ